MEDMPASLRDRFWIKVDKDGPENHDGTSCWLWRAGINNRGYGFFHVSHGTSPVYAHRFAYELLIGVIPKGLQLDHRHTCPKTCVNPDHLRVVSDKQNKENRPGAQRNSKTGVRGVSWDDNRNKWFAKVKHHGKQIFVGRFSTLEEARAAVIAKRNELFTHNDADRLSV